MNYIGIDPSTKTGFVALNADGEILDAREITTKEKGDIPRFRDLANEVMASIDIADKIAIEGFSYNSKGAGVSTQYGIGWIMRYELENDRADYTEISPNTLKKFATGKGTSKKEEMILPIYKRWGFEDKSDNIRDAYVLAQIARALDGKGNYTKAQMDCIKGL